MRQRELQQARITEGVAQPDLKISKVSHVRKFFSLAPQRGEGWGEG